MIGAISLLFGLILTFGDLVVVFVLSYFVTTSEQLGQFINRIQSFLSGTDPIESPMFVSQLPIVI